MTKKDYVKFAKLIRDARWFYRDMPAAGAVVRVLQTGIMDIFAEDSLRFNRETFYKACEPKER